MPEAAGHQRRQAVPHQTLLAKLLHLLHQPASEAVPGHGRHDEEDEEARAEGADAAWPIGIDARRLQALKLSYGLMKGTACH
jgi:hypothetical protein